MITRPFGQTGLHVSILGFGGSPLGGVFGEVDAAEGKRAVRAALDYGINLFDTAPFYGDTRAESALGDALRGVPREQFILSTKVGRYGADVFDFSAERTRRGVDESLFRLGLEHIDLIQAHDIEFGDIERIVHETIPALVALRETGKVRFIGVSGLHLHLLGRAMDSSPLDFVQNYCHGTLFDQSLPQWIESRGGVKVGVLNSAPLGMGLLTDKGPPAWHPADATLREVCIQAARLCREEGEDISALGLSYSAHLPGVSSTVIGMSTVAEVRSNLAALEPRSSSWLMDELRHRFARVPGVTWMSGRPENQPCAS